MTNANEIRIKTTLDGLNETIDRIIKFEIRNFAKDILSDLESETVHKVLNSNLKSMGIEEI